MLQIKMYIYCKTLLNKFKLKKKKAFENQKPINPFLFVPGCKRKSIKVINTLLVKWASATGISKAILITHIS